MTHSKNLIYKKLSVIIFVLIFTTTIFANNHRAIYIKKYSNESKIALVIGNSNYQHFSKLKNSKNDAYDMQQVLKSQGFDVLYLKNGSLKDMKKIVRKFAKKLKNGGIGFFFYAGHGLEVDGQNYLIPTNANIPEKNEVEYEALSMNMIIDKMEDSKNRLNIIVLDACRNDPYSRSGGGGLAQINNAEGMFVAFATAPGSVASDGSGRNGLFTKHLIENIQKPNLELDRIFKNTRIAVLDESNSKQRPWTSSSVNGDFYFSINGNKNLKLKKEIVVKKQKASINEEEQTFWNMILKEDSEEYYKMYLSEYPNGNYSNIADKKLEKYKQLSKLKQLENWSNIKNSTNGDDFTSFISKYPDSKYLKIAKLKAKKYQTNTLSTRDINTNNQPNQDMRTEIMRKTQQETMLKMQQKIMMEQQKNMMRR